jgi:glyoxylase-like metal-dependent hydrolase (beta-lactamase superfamily II)
MQINGEGLHLVAGLGTTHAWSSSAWLIKGRTGVALVDAGISLGYDALKRNLVDARVSPSDIDVVVLTHPHVDHTSGLTGLLNDGFVGQVMIHHSDRRFLVNGDAVGTAAFLYPGVAAHAYGVRPVHPQDGHVVQLGGVRLEIYHTPGHTRGSISIVCHGRRERVGLTGDTVWGHVNPAQADMRRWRGSIERIIGLDCTHLGYGHKGPEDPVLADPAEAVRALEWFKPEFVYPWYRPYVA